MGFVFDEIIDVIIVSMVFGAMFLLVHRKDAKARSDIIKAKKKMEEAYVKKSEFLAFTAHELRSPLSYIITASELMKAELLGELNSKYKEYVEGIHQNGHDLLAFIDDLLEQIKADDASFHIERKIVDINEVIKKAVKLNLNLAKRSKVRINVSIQSKITDFEADSRKLTQIINNLLSNSIKYSPQNSSVEIVALEEENKVVIAVEDHGFGMDEKELKIALSKFGKVPNKNTGKVSSIGLGLPLTKILVEAHGGRMLIESEKGVGTKITLKFPIKETMDGK